MAFRFFRRLKIFPGVTINLSKSGVSVSAGVQGAKVTVGNNGVRQTIGLPGTGLSHTTYTKHDSDSVPGSPSSTSMPQSQSVSLSKSAKNIIEESARSMVSVVNESLKIANESTNYETRVSSTQVTKDTIAKLKELAILHPDISLTSLDAVERSIEAVERETREEYSN